MGRHKCTYKKAKTLRCSDQLEVWVSIWTAEFWMVADLIFLRPTNCAQLVRYDWNQTKRFPRETQPTRLPIYQNGFFFMAFSVEYSSGNILSINKTNILLVHKSPTIRRSLTTLTTLTHAVFLNTEQGTRSNIYLCMNTCSMNTCSIHRLNCTCNKVKSNQLKIQESWNWSV